MDVKKLTYKQRFFCREFLKDFNATKSAIRAGYSAESARQIGSDLLTKHDILNQIEKYAKDINERTQNDIERIIEELHIIAFGSIKDVAEWDGNGIKIKSSKELEDEPRIVSEITQTETPLGKNIKLKLYDKIRALELLGRYHKLFTDKLEQETTIKTIEVKLAYNPNED